MSIKEALAKLDTKNDGHWTKEGLPSLELMRIYSGVPKLTRDELTAADPAFNRAIASGESAKQVEPVEKTFTQPAEPEKTPAVIAQETINASQRTLTDQELEKAFPGTLTAENEVRAKIKELEERFADATRAEEEIRVWKAQAVIDLQVLERQLPRKTNIPSTSANMEYLESQKNLAQTRAARQQELLAEGLTPARIASLLPHVNPIDRPRKK